MPTIRDYNPAKRKLNPNDRAQQAWETAGRRVGPLYNAAAADQREAGKVKGDMERAKIWPFDIYALENSLAPQVKNTKETTSRETGREDAGSSIRVVGSLNPLSRGRGGLRGGTGNIDPGDWAYTHGEASAGAAGMSRLARNMVSGSDAHKSNENTTNPELIGRPDWYYDGSHKIEGPDGKSITPYQADILKRYNERQDEHTQAKADRANAIAERDAARESKYWDDFTKRREIWIAGGRGEYPRQGDLGIVGNAQRDWQENYDADMKHVGKATDKVNSDAMRDARKAAEDKGEKFDPSTVRTMSADDSEWRSTVLGNVHSTSYKPRPAPYQNNVNAENAEYDRVHTPASYLEAPVVGAARVVVGLRDILNAMGGGTVDGALFPAGDDPRVTEGRQ